MNLTTPPCDEQMIKSLNKKTTNYEQMEMIKTIQFSYIVPITIEHVIAKMPRSKNLLGRHKNEAFSCCVLAKYLEFLLKNHKNRLKYVIHYVCMK